MTTESILLTMVGTFTVIWSIVIENDEEYCHCNNTVFLHCNDTDISHPGIDHIPAKSGINTAKLQDIKSGRFQFYFLFCLGLDCDWSLSEEML